jgi:NAD(P)-dependent dehydrogenase (short-subunit alcohol dehydrogenase family)
MSASFADLAGKVAIVTGGAQGIGLATVDAMVAQGMKVGVIDIDPDYSRALVARHGAGIHLELADLRDAAAGTAAVLACLGALGPAAVLVNNAAHDDRHRFDEIDVVYWDERMAVNLRHMFYVTQAVLPGMRAAGKGSIINLGSTSWMQGAAGLIAYTTAKSAVSGFTRSLARELGPDGIRVNCVTPGWVMTERQRRLRSTPERLAAAQQRQSIKGEIMPEDVAPMILFLASDAARMCTGQNYIVDAGVV